MKFKIEGLGGIQSMQQVAHTSDSCSNCGTDSKCRRRDFSEQAWTVLVLWNEVQTAAVDQPICEECYDDLREVLIDRANEIEVVLSEAVVAKKSVTDKSAAGRQKVRKAS